MSKEALELHDEAMSLEREAASARRQRDVQLADRLAHQAYLKDAEAAALLENRVDSEPWRAILHRSAAVLAKECNELRAAEKLVGRALAGEPPEEIAEELRELWDDIRFGLYLDRRKIELAPEKFQLMLKGPATGNGMASEQEVRARIGALGRLVYRTAERELERPYRDTGRMTRALRREFQLYLSKAEQPGYSITISIGSEGPQALLPGAVDCGPRVLDELLECLELFDQSDFARLAERIPDPAYYRNFVSLACKLAPDGEEVTNVALAVTRSHGQKIVTLTNPPPQAIIPNPAVEARKITIHGIPRFSDSSSELEGKLHIENEFGHVEVIRIPEGQLSDVVRPMLDEEIEITAHWENDEWVLDSIETAEASLIFRTRKAPGIARQGQAKHKNFGKGRRKSGPR